MNILHAHGTNFQSYETIEFSYNTLGLVLISGETGAGKSTAMDLVSWCLYGKTSKGTAADDIRSWDATEPTTGVATVDTPQGSITVYRTRGASNDLYWVEDEVSSEPCRGSSLSETQKLLEARLGVSADLFIVGSYLTQFSDADTFFIARADRRRDTMEKIADQEWAIKLGVKASEARILAKKQAAALETELSGISGKLDALTSSLQSLNNSSKLWQSNLEKKISAAVNNQFSFEEEQTKKRKEYSFARNLRRVEIDRKMVSESMKILPPGEITKKRSLLETTLADLGEATCSKCGAPDKGGARQAIQQALSVLTYEDRDSAAAHIRYLELNSQGLQIDREVNPYESQQSNPYGLQLEALAQEVNPFGAQVTLTKESIDEASRSEIRVNVSLREAQSQVSRLNWLYDKSFELRGLLMQRAVSQVQDKTNYYLEKFFDAAIRITLTLEGSDKLQIMIYNNGHLCSFPSLSGGERCMLKLAFSLSLMRAAQNKAGVAFGMIMLDEPLSGLDDSLKVKAYGLLQELATEYPTVLVIEHSEAFKSMFDRRFNVTKNNGCSSIDTDE